ncbi:hypothetical protein [Halomonas tibetensis]|uniref:Uncharacterized protein n=1 Tax=Halomonas tibetensis TaxID=2259590 RepID=A0ABV7B573_9GAMM
MAIAVDGIITGGSVTSSRNEIWAESTANSARNALNLEATTSAVNAALASGQYNEGDVTATLTAPGTSVTANGGNHNGTAINLEDNVSVALSRGNDAVNRLTAEGDVLTNSAGATATTDNTGLASAEGGFAVLNRQTNIDNEIASRITASGGNNVSITSGLVNGRVNVSGNQVVAEATANRTGNSIALNDANGTAGSAALTSYQRNSGVTTVASITGVGNSINGGTGNSGGSSFNVTNNTVQARAVGNAGTNSNVTSLRSRNSLGL